MRKSLNQIIREATERLPDQIQVSDNFWSTTVADGIGGIVTVTFVKYHSGWNFHSTNY